MTGWGALCVWVVVGVHQGQYQDEQPPQHKTKRNGCILESNPPDLPYAASDAIAARFSDSSTSV